MIMEEDRDEIVVISSSSESMEDDGPPDGNLSKKMKVENGVIDSKSDMEVEIVEEERELVAILDAGAQYGKVIDRRIRELNVESVMLPIDTAAEELMMRRFKAIIISGSGNSVNEDPQYDANIFNLGVPVLGICYGFHLIVKHFGGVVSKENTREDGQFEVRLDSSCALFANISRSEKVLLTHGDTATALPDCLKAVGWSGEMVAAVAHTSAPIYGIQFHPEVELTINGGKIFKTFLYEIALCSGMFEIKDRELLCIGHIREQVKDGIVMSLVSGGVDSTVCTALLGKALGKDRVAALHIDNGFMRQGEKDQVQTTLKEVGINPQVLDAALTFSNATTTMTYRDHDGQLCKQETPFLHAVTNAEEKRHIIGDTFMRLAIKYMRHLEASGRTVFLAQGTLRPDLIESASALASTNAHVIKTHHNDTALVRDMRDKGRIVEPLIDFHKDEVRNLGKTLGLPDQIVYRHPFPGPGLAIRILCQEDPYIRDDFTHATAVLNNITSFHLATQMSSGPVNKIMECVTAKEQDLLVTLTQELDLNAMLLPICSVGVQGDSRSYNYVVALSSDTPYDKLKWPDIMALAKLIPRVLHCVNRVVWVFGDKVKYSITDVTPTHLTRGVIATLREVDHVTQTALLEHGLLRNISQMPVVLIPIHFDRNPDQRPQIPSCQRSVVIRTFITQDFMTGVPAVPGEQITFKFLEDAIEQILLIPGISRVLYDLTPKPPGTTEWE